MFKPILAAAAVAAGALMCAAPAHADSLTAYQTNWADQDAYSTCRVLDVYMTGNLANDTTVAVNMAQWIYEHTPDSWDSATAVHILNYEVYTYCPQHWDNLVAIGDAARNGDNGGDVLR